MPMDFAPAPPMGPDRSHASRAAAPDTRATATGNWYTGAVDSQGHAVDAWDFEPNTQGILTGTAILPIAIVGCEVPSGSPTWQSFVSQPDGEYFGGVLGYSEHTCTPGATPAPGVAIRTFKVSDGTSMLEISENQSQFATSQTVINADGSVSDTSPFWCFRLGRSSKGATAAPPAACVNADTVSASSYMALGDSYSSGEGNPPYEPGTDDEGKPDLCHRSMAAYGPLLDQALNLGGMMFKACSGAVTNDVFDASGDNPTEPPQLSWLRPYTKTVTLTLGGNDAGFPWVLEHCVAAPPLRNNFGCSVNTRLEAETQARLNALAGGSYATTPPPLSQPIHSVLSVIQAIHGDAPPARILVGLYPTLLGKSKANYALNIAAPGRSACEVGNFLGFGLWIDYKDAQWLNKRGEQLNAIIKKAVATAAHERIAVGYVKPSQFVGHGFCDTSELWFHPLELKLSHLPELEVELSPKSSSFHPTNAGQQLGYETAFAAKLK